MTSKPGERCGHAVDCVEGNVPGAALALCANFFTSAVNTRTEGVELVANYAAPLAGRNFDLTLAIATADTEIGLLWVRRAPG